MIHHSFTWSQQLRPLIAGTVILLTISCQAAEPPLSRAARERRLATVRQFADNVLEHGRDQWGDYQSPLFADGINVKTLKPVVWRYQGHEWIISNFASQQNLLRTLVGLSNLTEDPQYRAAAWKATEHMFARHRAGCGLLYWGGHQFVDLKTGRNHGEFDADCHEFKNNFPFYEFLWQVNPEATRKFLRAFWNAHIMDWNKLDMNRHGAFNQPMGELWDHEFADPDPFFAGRGLNFITTGTDLVYAGATLHLLGREEGALLWARRMAEQYVKARHPETGLGVYQYSKLERREEPPADGPLTGRLTWDRYGDRAENQFGAVYGDVAREGWVLWGTHRPRAVYAISGLMLLELAERLGPEGTDFLNWTLEGLRSFARQAYRKESNDFRPMWADGTDLSGQTYPRTGYYGSQGQPFAGTRACTMFLLTYARAARLSGDAEMWEMARNIARAHGMGDLGVSPGRETDLNLQTENAGANLLFALLEIYKADNYPGYLELAAVIADNIIERRFHNGFFMPAANRLNARFDEVDPLAVLAVEAALQGKPEKVPAYNFGRGFIHGRFDGAGRTYDGPAIWSQRR